MGFSLPLTKERFSRRWLKSSSFKLLFVSIPIFYYVQYVLFGS
jgi:hypothetical protein